jgi:hypothetical protein
MATEFKIKGIPEMRDRFLKMIQDTAKDKETLNNLGKVAVPYIQGMSRAGKDAYKVNSVKPSTAKARVRLAEFNETDQAYTKNKALTFTGEFIDSLTFSIQNDSVKLSFSGNHAPYKGKDGNVIGKKISNETLYQYLKQGGRDILFLSDKLKIILEKEVVRNVRRRIILFKSALNKLK